MRIPDNEQTVWSDVSGDNPTTIIAAASARDGIGLK